MTLCRTGLFVGVDQYERLESLPGARASAYRLKGYFEAALPNGNWSLVADEPSRRVDRAEVLRAIHEWVHSVPANAAGLMYFSGHGAVSSEGMVLAARDFHFDLAYDSGIPLKRILDIVAAGGGRHSHYIIMLDACRTGQAAGTGERIPDNVWIIYACEEGGISVGQSASTAYVRAFLEAIKKLRLLRLIDTCDLHLLASAIQDELAAGPTSRYQKIELKGATSSPITIPVVYQGGEDASPPAEFPDCFLVSREISEEVCELLRQKFMECVKAWMTFDVEQYDRFIRYGDISMDGSRHLTFQLPRPNAFQDPHVLLQYVLNKCHGRIYKVSMRWQGPIPLSPFLKLPHALNGLECDCVDDAEALMRWSVGSIRGIIRVRIGEYQDAQLDITCRSTEGNGLSVDRLLPNLNTEGMGNTFLTNVFDCLANIKTKTGETDG